MKTIKVDYLARVEGEGAVRIRFRGDEVRDVAVRIFEPPRFFEAFLRGRSYTEVPDITARICGICPVAYQMSSCAAMEDALGIEVGPAIAALRRLLYCGEWIESHALHMFFLHAPDFLGYPDAIAMAREHREIVLAGLAIKKAGNAIIGLVGGREIHPINPRVGGFHSLPPRGAMRELIAELERARQAAFEALEWMGRLNYPDYECDYEFVAVDAGGEYPFIGNRLISNRGLDISVRDYDGHFEERQVPHSNALHSRLKERGAYLCGPLARFNLHFDKLSAAAREAAQRVNLTPPCRNPFKSIMVRGVEVAFALEQAIELIESLRRHRRTIRSRAGDVIDRVRGERGAPRHAVPSLSDRRRRHYSRRRDNPADLAEPGVDRGRPQAPGPAHDRHDPSRRHPPRRAGRAQLRSLHLVRHAFPEAHAGKGIERLGRAYYRRGAAMGR